MKVGLITFHNAYNYGAVLQAYATQKSLLNMGCDCDIINYVNEHRSHAYDMMFHAKKAIANRQFKSCLKFLIGNFFMNKRKKKFLAFQSKFMQITKEKYCSAQEADSLNKVYDKFIVGSDQVWNCNHNGGDFAYFLNFVKDNQKKISYASSFGLASIPTELRNEYSKYLKEINRISVREEIGGKIVEELTGKKAELVLDPVFLLSKQEWLKFCNVRRSSKPYLFAYTNKNNQIENFLNETKPFFSKTEIHKISRHTTLKDFLDPRVKVCYSISPINFIESIYNSKLVITASFHCVAMSIILNKPFVAILTGNPGKDERLINLLKIAGLTDCIFKPGWGKKGDFTKVDFDSVNVKIESLRQKSINFLKKALV